MNKILPNALSLIALKQEQLEDIFTGLNSANSHELIRRLVQELKNEVLRRDDAQQEAAKWRTMVCEISEIIEAGKAER